jgi:hypothetical protein
MNAILIILGTLGSAFSVVMTVLYAINFRKPRKITLLSEILSGLIALLGLAAMIFLGGIWVAPYLSSPLFLVGILLGYLRAVGVKMNWENGHVVGRNSIFFMVIWGFSLSLSQLLGLFGSPLLASLGLIPTIFTTGIQMGYYAHIFLRRLAMWGKEKNRKILQIFISIGGIIALSLITLISVFWAWAEITNTINETNLFSGTQHKPENYSSDFVFSPAETEPSNLNVGLASNSQLPPPSGLINHDSAVQNEICWDIDLRFLISA